MARPYSLTVIEDIAISGEVKNLLEGEPGRVLDEPSRIRIYATRETVLVGIGITLGREVSLPNNSPANLNAVNGTLPSRQDDLLVETFGAGGEEIIIKGQNADGAAANELRVLVDVKAVTDIIPGD